MEAVVFDGILDKVRWFMVYDFNMFMLKICNLLNMNSIIA